MCHRRGCHAAGTSSSIAAALLIVATVASSANHALKFANDGIVPVSSSTTPARSEKAVVTVKVEGTERTHSNRREAARRVVAFVPRRREGR